MKSSMAALLGATFCCLALPMPSSGAEAAAPGAPTAPTIFGGHSSPPIAALFSADGSRLFTQDKRQAFLWDTGSGAPLGSCGDVRPGQPATFIDNRRVAVAEYGSARVLDAETGQKLLELEAVGKSIRSLAAAPDGKALFGGVSGKGDRDKNDVGELVVWSLESGKVLRRHALGDFVTPKCMAFTSDGRSLVVSACTNDDAALLVAAGTGAVTARFRHSPWKSVSPEEVACQPRGALIAATSTRDDGRHLRIWRQGSIEPAKVLVFEEYYSQANKLAFAPDGAQLLTGESGPQGALRCWDMTGLKKVWTQPSHRGGVLAVAYAPGGRAMLSVGCDGVLARRGPADGKLQQEFRLCAHAQSDMPGGRTCLAACLTADGRGAVSAGQDGTVRLWDLESGRELKRTLASGSAAPAASADRKRLLVGVGKSLVTWDIEKWAEAGKLDLPGQPRTLTATPGLNLAFVTVFRNSDKPGSKASAFLIDVRAGGAVKELPELAAAGRAAFSDDGKLLAVGAGESVEIFDAESGAPVRTIAAKGVNWESLDLVFSADGLRLFRTTSDSRAPLVAWDTKTWQPAGCEGLALARLQFVVAAGGKRLGLVASAGKQAPGTPRACQIADLADGKVLGAVAMGPHLYTTDVMDVSADGRTVLAGLRNGQLALWRLEASQAP